MDPMQGSGVDESFGLTISQDRLDRSYIVSSNKPKWTNCVAQLGFGIRHAPAEVRH
ncbi:hypothetical protein QIS74_08870 [Colletotrichum tabaci]|uniref:Uncharacterized protein n=1 Tax=Colletotrichum tabaci TaxID=1209068 RepID=A0AAV9T2M0_9PEZI